MPVEHVTSAADPRLADYRAIAEPDLVRSRGLFVAEGRLVVRRLIEERRFKFRSLLMNEAAFRSLNDALSSIAGDIPIYVCRPSDFSGITGHNIHRGCLALVERPAALAARDIAAAARTLVVLEGVTNPDNIGGVFRNIAAFGGDGALLSPTCADPLYRKAVRTSMAATLRVPFARLDPWPDGLAALRSDGFTLVALTPRHPSVPLDTFAARLRPARMALLVGTEGEGLTPLVEAAADVRVRIPILPAVDSLNLAVAVGIALYRLSVSDIAS